MPLPLTVDCGHECVKIPDRPVRFVMTWVLGRY